MRVNTNVAAIAAMRNLNTVGVQFGKSVEKLSSGLRINRAGDDAAGLGVSEKLRAQVRGLNQATRNAQDAISMIQTAEGALSEVHAMLQRMRELAVQGANATLTDTDRSAVNTEVQALRAEVDAIKDRTTFNGQYLLFGGLDKSAPNTAVVASGSELTVGDFDANVLVRAITLTSNDTHAAETYFFTFDTVDKLTLTRTSDGAAKTVTLADVASGVTATVGAKFDFATGTDVEIQIEGLGADGAKKAEQGNFFTNASFNSLTTVVNGNKNALYHIGPDANQTLSVAFEEVSVKATGLTTALDALNAGTATATEFETLISDLDSSTKGIAFVSDVRADLGAAQNRLESTVNNLQVASENVTAAESRIRDVDVAAETVNFSRLQIMREAGLAVLAQANLGPQSVLALLR